MPRIKANSSGDGTSGWARLREFLSAHLLLLLLPLVAPLAGDQLFPAPAAYPPIKFIGAFLCVFAALFVVSCREHIAFRITFGRIRQRIIPSVLAAFAAALGSFSAAVYLKLVRDHPDDARAIFLYVIPWSCFTASATIVFIVLYYQYGRGCKLRSVQAKLAHFLSPENQLKRLNQIACYYDLAAHNHALKAIGSVIVTKLAKQLDDLEFGRLKVDAFDVPTTFTTLGSQFTRFDGVSVCPLLTWTQSQHAKQYLEVNRHLVQKGLNLTRVFVAWRGELREPSFLADVLRAHWRSGIACAVVVADELPLSLRRLCDHDELHFGLWDLDQACTKFEMINVDAPPEMTLVFGANWQSREEILERLSIYKEILRHVWLVDKTFKDLHAELVTEDSLRQTRKDVARRLNVNLDGKFPIEVTDLNLIDSSVRYLAMLAEDVTKNSTGTKEVTLIEMRMQSPDP
jgi:hypothetical protein